KPHVALALVTRVVDDDQQTPAVAAFPRPGEESVVGPVAVPGLRGVEEAPCALAEDGAAQDFQEPLIERAQPFVNRLPGPAHGVGGGAVPATRRRGRGGETGGGAAERGGPGPPGACGGGGGGRPSPGGVSREPGGPGSENRGPP